MESNLDFGFLNGLKPPLNVPSKNETVEKWWFEEADGTCQCYYCHRRWREDHLPISQGAWYIGSKGTCFVGIKIKSARIDPITHDRIITTCSLEVPCVYCTPSVETKAKIQKFKNTLQAHQEKVFENSKKRSYNKTEKDINY